VIAPAWKPPSASLVTIALELLLAVAVVALLETLPAVLIVSSFESTIPAVLLIWLFVIIFGVIVVVEPTGGYITN